MECREQMSESAVVIAFLCISGGFQDAYTYNCRDEVFANAQTGNMVLMGQNFAMGNWYLGIRYLLPVLAFAMGIYAAEKIRGLYGQSGRIHWRQIVILLEAAALFAVGFMPRQVNLPANMLVSFVCAMQVQSFRKLKGSAYATTMCIGNLRAATELWCSYRFTGNKETKKKSLLYYGYIGIFILGAAVGGIMTMALTEKAIWMSSGLLLAVFFMMFRKE
ncbi:YoaK family protein [Petralouisia muris]|nr:YoaK family protein [Petralouisia muris]